MRRAALIVLLLVLGSTVDAYACKCNQLGKLSRKSVEMYDIIFTGRVAAVSGDDVTERVQFTVLELFKGTSYQTIELQQNAGSDCSFSFAPGETWTIYGKWQEYDVVNRQGVPTTNFCTYSRRQPITAADDFEDSTRSKYAVELQFLRDSLGVQPFMDPAEHKDLLHKNELPGPGLAFGYLTAGLLGLGLIFFFVKRMFRRDGK